MIFIPMFIFSLQHHCQVNINFGQWRGPQGDNGVVTVRVCVSLCLDGTTGSLTDTFQPSSIKKKSRFYCYLLVESSQPLKQFGLMPVPSCQAISFR